MMKSLSLLFAALFALIFLAGCGGDGSNENNPVTLVSVTPHIDAELEELDALILEQGAEDLTVSTALGGYGTVEEGNEITDSEVTSIWDVIKQITETLYNYGIRPKYGLWASTVEFKWGTNGNKESGLVTGPRTLVHQHDYPMIVLCHPTQTLRSQSPSHNRVDDELTVPFAWYLATLGYVVVIPDYPGLGVNNDVHPYCLTTLSKSVIGMIYAAKQLGLRWDGRIFLMGYSEGGYAATVTAKDIQQNYSKKLDLVGLAALDAPHSLSQAMHKVMLESGADYATPYFLPYVVAGYEKKYPDTITFQSAVKDDPKNFRSELYSMLFGDYSGGQITNKMKTITPYVGARAILTNETISKLNDETSQLNGLFKENDSFYNWKPAESLQVFLAHNSLDDSVPFENTELAQKAWQNLSNVEVVHFTDYVPGLGTIHAGALPFAYIRGTYWIHQLAYD